MKKNFYAFLMSLGHGSVDVNQGALSAILPFLVASYHYDYATVATLVMIFSIVGSVVQPFLGDLADKHYSSLILPTALILACGGMAMTGFTSNYTVLCICVVLSGIGVAMYHPVGVLITNKTAPKDAQGNAVSIFAFGGTMGFTLGPIIIGLSTAVLGMHGTITLLIPAIICITCLWWKRKEVNELMANSNYKKKAKAAGQGKDNWSAFFRLCGVIFGRSMIFYGLQTFLILYWIDVLGQARALGATMLSVLFACGSLSTLVCGRIADKVGYRKMIRISFCILFPCFACFAFFQNLYVATIILIPMGLAMNANYAAFVVLSQRYLPNHPGLAGGVSLGLAISVGGILTPVLGHLADTYGLISVFYALTAITVVPLISSFILPPDPVQDTIEPQKA